LVGSSSSEQVGRLQQEPAQRDAAALAAGQRSDSASGGGSRSASNRELESRVEIPGVRRIDLVLDARLLVEDLFHVVRRQILAELRVHRLVPSSL